MKKIFSILAAALLVATAFTATSCKKSPDILWNVQAQASGNGKIIVTYPTGNPGLVVEGVATATATTTNDSTVLVFAAPADALFAEDVLANPDAYSKQDVKDAEALMNEVNNKAVEFHAEGEWEASVTGYAKYGQMYFVINEHWPVDTVAVAVVE